MNRNFKGAVIGAITAVIVMLLGNAMLPEQQTTLTMQSSDSGYVPFVEPTTTTTASPASPSSTTTTSRFSGNVIKAVNPTTTTTTILTTTTEIGDALVIENPNPTTPTTMPTLEGTPPPNMTYGPIVIVDSGMEDVTITLQLINSDANPMASLKLNIEAPTPMSSVSVSGNIAGSPFTFNGRMFSPTMGLHMLYEGEVTDEIVVTDVNCTL